jgi:fucose 4-O-acetylase-like acetyltransferase
VDSNFKIKAGLFLKLGQNTLPIYIVHVIILYGGIFGFGLVPNLFDRNLNPIGAICISITAILAFVAFIKYIEPLEVFYNRFLNKISPKRGTNHFSGD